MKTLDEMIRDAKKDLELAAEIREKESREKSEKLLSQQVERPRGGHDDR